MDDKSVSKPGVKDHIGIRTGHTTSIIASVKELKEYLTQHPADYLEQVDSLLELIYMAYTEYNSVETPELKAGISEAEKELRSLVDTEAERERYMNAVYHMCAIFEKVAYIEGMKTGARLVMELEKD